MKSVIKEYASMLIAFVSALGILSIVAIFLMGKNSFFAQLIRVVTEGGL